MDTIKFIITETSEVKNTPYQSCDVVVQFNEEELPHGFFNANQVMAASHIDFVEFDLFTCSCGEPGCAGFQAPVFQKKSDNQVTWQFPLEEMYHTQKKLYTFDKQQFEQEFLNLFNELQKLEKENTFLASNFDHMGYEEQDLGFEPHPPITIAEGTDWWKNRLFAESKAHSIITETVGDSFSDSYTVQYEDKSYPHKVSAYDLIGSIINDFPRGEDDDVYFDKLKKATDAFALALKGDYNKIVDIIQSSYAENDLEAKDFICRWFWEFENNEADLDVKKIRFINKPL
jgi:hypothetical protein